jgi:hypothetical protein
MDFSFSKDSFPKIKLFVATPMYGGVCKPNYLGGMMDLSSGCTSYNIPMRFCGIVNESLVQKARNLCVEAFMQSDFTHFLFIDADVGFTAKDVFSLLYLVSSDEEEKYDVLAGPYPKKAISWKKVKAAVKQGFADEDAASLENYIGNYTFLAPPGTSFPLNAPVEVSDIGTGFMMIPRRTFEKFIKAYPKNTYKASNGKRQTVFFDCAIRPDTRLFLAEDRFFCHAVKDMGGKVWLAPWLKLTHQGLYPFKESVLPSLV